MGWCTLQPMGGRGVELVKEAEKRCKWGRGMEEEHKYDVPYNTRHKTFCCEFWWNFFIAWDHFTCMLEQAIDLAKFCLQLKPNSYIESFLAGLYYTTLSGSPAGLQRACCVSQSGLWLSGGLYQELVYTWREMYLILKLKLKLKPTRDTQCANLPRLTHRVVGKCMRAKSVKMSTILQKYYHPKSTTLS